MRSIMLTTTLIAATVTLTACDHPVAGPPPPSPATTHATASSPAATASSSRPAAATTTPASDPGDGDAAPCVAGSIAVTIDDTEGAGGHISAAVHFRNTGRVNCWLSGYPVVTALDASGGRIGRAEPTLRGPGGGLPANDNDPSPYLLAPGEQVSSTVEAGNRTGSGGDCGPVPALLVAPPGITRPTRVPWSDGCAGFEVHPLTRTALPVRR